MQAPADGQGKVGHIMDWKYPIEYGSLNDKLAEEKIVYDAFNAGKVQAFAAGISLMVLDHVYNEKKRNKRKGVK